MNVSVANTLLAILRDRPEHPTSVNEGLLKAAQTEGVSLHLRTSNALTHVALALEIEKEIARRGLMTKLSALNRVMEIAKQLNIPLYPLKGAWYLQQRLPNARLRVMADIDLAAPKATIALLNESLQSEGYFPEPVANRHLFHADLHAKWSFTSSILGRKPLLGPKVSLDLHWDPVYDVDGRKVRLNFDRLWKAAPAKLFPQLGCAHALVHTASSATLEKKLPLYRMWDLACLQRKFSFSFDELRLWILAPDAETFAILERFWLASQALIAGKTDEWLALRARPYRMSDWTKREPHTFWQIRKVSDQVRFLSGYFLSPRRYK